MLNVPRSRARRFVPRLEALDDRALPSTSVVESAGVLTIWGDQRDNTVAIEDNGTDAAGNVHVVVDGTDYTSEGIITKVRVFTGSGQDTVTYELTGDLASGAQRRVGVVLGNQDDSFNANLTGNLLADSELTFVVWAGNGQDTLNVGGTGGDVAAGALLGMKLFGGNGKDVISVDYSGLVLGSTNFGVNGCNGVDTIGMNLNLASGSTGTVRARVFGGNAPDLLTLNVTQEVETDTVAVDAIMNGGHGKDTFEHTPNVDAVDAPKV